MSAFKDNEVRSVAMAAEMQGVINANKTNRSTATQPKEATALTSLAQGQVLKLDPDRVGPSRFANRAPFNWQTKAFNELRENIREKGGNVQPVKVRPAPPGAKTEFEIVFGHRRHRACLEEGLPLLAFVEPVSDRSLVVEMAMENAGRRDCCAYERGLQFKKILEAGLFGTHDELAAAMGFRDCSLVSRLIKLAELPDAVIKAFRSPADLQVKWGTKLAMALREDASGVLARAEQIAQTGTPKAPKEVLRELAPTKIRQPGGQLTGVHELRRAGRKIGVMTVHPPARGGGVGVTIEPGVVSEEVLFQALRKLLRAD